jgi:hypothetical protein
MGVGLLYRLVSVLTHGNEWSRWPDGTAVFVPRCTLPFAQFRRARSIDTPLPPTYTKGLALCAGLVGASHASRTAIERLVMDADLPMVSSTREHLSKVSPESYLLKARPGGSGSGAGAQMGSRVGGPGGVVGGASPWSDTSSTLRPDRPSVEEPMGRAGGAGGAGGAAGGAGSEAEYWSQELASDSSSSDSAERAAGAGDVGGGGAGRLPLLPPLEPLGAVRPFEALDQFSGGSGDGQEGRDGRDEERQEGQEGHGAQRGGKGSRRRDEGSNTRRGGPPPHNSPRPFNPTALYDDDYGDDYGESFVLDPIRPGQRGGGSDRRRRRHGRMCGTGTINKGAGDSEWAINNGA